MTPVGTLLVAFVPIGYINFVIQKWFRKSSTEVSLFCVDSESFSIILRSSCFDVPVETMRACSFQISRRHVSISAYFTHNECALNPNRLFYSSNVQQALQTPPFSLIFLRCFQELQLFEPMESRINFSLTAKVLLTSLTQYSMPYNKLISGLA